MTSAPIDIHCPYCGNVAASLTVAEPDEPDEPVIVKQQLPFGQHTKAGHGGIKLVAGATITAGNEAGHWQISADGVVTPTPVGEGSLTGSYELTIHAGDAEAAADFIVTIAIEPDTYDVATMAEFKAVLPKNVSPALVNGKTIMLRPGQFGDPNSGTLQIIEGVRANPATPLTITCRQPHQLWVGATEIVRELGNPGILPRLRILRCSGIRFAGIGFHHNRYAGATDGSTMVAVSLDLDSIIFDGCHLWCQEDIEGEDNINCIGTDGNTNETSRGVIIRNCAIHDGRTLINAMTPAMIIEGNYLYNAHVDFIHLGIIASGSRIRWNVLYRPTIASSKYHPDFIQTIVAGQNNNLDDVELIGNRCFTGDVTQSSQGFYFDNFKDGAGVGSGRHTNLTMKGNLLVGLAGRGISIGLTGDNPIENVTVIGNTVVRDKRLPADANVTVGILLHSDTIDCVMKNNVAEQITAAKDGLEANNNVVLGENGVTIPYSQAFTGNADDDFKPDSVEALMRHYAMRPGGPLDLAACVGAVGSGYVDWERRTLNRALEE